MTSLSLTAARRHAHPVGNAITALALALMAVSLVSLGTGSERRAFAAGTLQGAVTFADSSGAITSGGSADFTVKVPTGAACQGSGAQNFRWETFLVSDAVDVGALTFGSGPNPVAGSFVSAMFSSDGEAVSTKFPAASPLGLISGIPQLSLPNTSTPLAAGSYKIGVACQLSGAIQEFWSENITVTGSTFAWAVAIPPVATTTTSTKVLPTTTGGGTSTTTTVRAATTSTTSTTSTTVASSLTTTNAFVGAGAIPTTRPPQVIVAAGNSPLPLLVWAVLLLALGRIVVLLGRPPRVIPPST